MGCGASTGGSVGTVVQRDPAEESARATLEQALRDGELQAIAASNLQLGESAGGESLEAVAFHSGCSLTAFWLLLLCTRVAVQVVA